MSNVILLHLKLCILSQPMKLKPEKFISNNVAIGLGTSRNFEKKTYGHKYYVAASIGFEEKSYPFIRKMK